MRKKIIRRLLLPWGFEHDEAVGKLKAKIVELRNARSTFPHIYRKMGFDEEGYRDTMATGETKLRRMNHILCVAENDWIDFEADEDGNIIFSSEDDLLWCQLRYY